MSLELPCPSCGVIRVYSTLAGKDRAIKSKTVCKKCAGAMVPLIKPMNEPITDELPISGSTAYVPLSRFFDRLEAERKKRGA
jgi:hypothetical protein